jgi:urease accessory protein
MKRFIRIAAALLLAGSAGAALAHTGQGTASLFEGLAHPLAPDHLLAMLAVGLWSVLALPAGRKLAGPAVFLACMTAGAAAGAAGLALPLVEQGIALSVALFGAMLAAGRRLPVAAGLIAVAAAAALHGLAHGAEVPAGAGFAVYAGGFLATTALLHGAGLLLADRLQHLGLRAWQATGGALAMAGLMLLLRA